MSLILSNKKTGYLKKVRGWIRCFQWVPGYQQLSEKCIILYFMHDTIHSGGGGVRKEVKHCLWQSLMIFCCVFCSQNICCTLFAHFFSFWGGPWKKLLKGLCHEMKIFLKAYSNKPLSVHALIDFYINKDKKM